MSNEKQPPTPVSRRTFMGTAATAAGITIVPRHVLGGTGFQAPSDTVNVAIVGFSHGMGTSNLESVAKSDNIAALCDCDESEAAKAAMMKRGTLENHPNATRHKDWRVMLEKQKDIDADGQRGPGAHRGCTEVQGRDPDGQSGPLGRGAAPHAGVAHRRRDRAHSRGALLDEPPDLAPGHAPPDRDPGSP